MIGLNSPCCTRQLCCASEKETLVLGAGNPLRSDDGLGARAIERLRNEPLPQGVRLEDAGTPGLELPLWFEGASKVIIIDAVRMGEPPGTWRRFSLDEVLLLSHENIISLHQSDLGGGLALAQSLKMLPEEVIFYAVEPENIEWGQELSPAVEAALPVILEEIKAELRKREE